MTENLAGEQLDSRILYERQKELRESGAFPSGPTVVAVGLTVPENVGMVLRLADAAGASRVIFINTETPNRARIRKTARNADVLVRWEFCEREEFLRETYPVLPPLIAIELTTRSTNIFETSLPVECTLVVGSEQHGIPAAILQMCQQAVHIPLFGVNGSMNVTHALAVTLFEWRRQHPSEWVLERDTLTYKDESTD